MDLGGARARRRWRARVTASRMTKDADFFQNRQTGRRTTPTRARRRRAARRRADRCEMDTRRVVCARDAGTEDDRTSLGDVRVGLGCVAFGDASAKSESAKMTVTRGAEEAAALACETLNSVSSSASASASARAVVDVVWFGPSAGRDASSGEETRYDDAGEWTPAMVAAYGCFVERKVCLVNLRAREWCRAGEGDCREARGRWRRRLACR